MLLSAECDFTSLTRIKAKTLEDHKTNTTLAVDKTVRVGLLIFPCYHEVASLMV